MELVCPNNGFGPLESVFMPWSRGISVAVRALVVLVRTRVLCKRLTSISDSGSPPIALLYCEIDVARTMRSSCLLEKAS